jgi:hypothetical protein
MRKAVGRSSEGIGELVAVPLAGEAVSRTGAVAMEVYAISHDTAMVPVEAIGRVAQHLL